MTPVARRSPWCPASRRRTSSRDEKNHPNRRRDRRDGRDEDATDATDAARIARGARRRRERATTTFSASDDGDGDDDEAGLLRSRSPISGSAPSPRRRAARLDPPIRPLAGRGRHDPLRRCRRGRVEALGALAPDATPATPSTANRCFRKTHFASGGDAAIADARAERSRRCRSATRARRRAASARARREGGADFG